jgi:hypothetical protein
LPSIRRISPIIAERRLDCADEILYDQDILMEANLASADPPNNP